MVSLDHATEMEIHTRAPLKTKENTNFLVLIVKQYEKGN